MEDRWGHDGFKSREDSPSPDRYNNRDRDRDYRGSSRDRDGDRYRSRDRSRERYRERSPRDRSRDRSRKSRDSRSPERDRYRDNRSSRDRSHSRDRHSRHSRKSPSRSPSRDRSRKRGRSSSPEGPFAKEGRPRYENGPEKPQPEKPQAPSYAPPTSSYAPPTSSSFPTFSSGNEVQGRYGLEDEGKFAPEMKSSAPRIDFSKYDEIPVETSGRDVPPGITKFTDVDLGKILTENIRKVGYDRPTPVQKHSIPIVLANRDLMACAQTGSGKTAAFLFPVISRLCATGPSQPDRYSRKVFPLALVLAPTRELACQIQDECRKFSQYTGLKSLVVYGGSPINLQLRELERGCDILVATPGRLVDIMERDKISLAQIRFLILDEADRMLDMGFEPQIRKIVEQKDMTKKGVRRTLMFSATFAKEIQQLASQFLEDYVFLAVGRVGSTAELVTQKFVKCTDFDKQDQLVEILRNSDQGLTLIFVETKKSAEQLGFFLQRKGFRASSIHGDRAQKDRTAAIKNFATGVTPYLVATNVAARGLDIENITHVINFDMPGDMDDYVHRIGRTGRAGKTGISTSLISPSNANIVAKLLDILDEAGQEPPKWLDDMRFDRAIKKPKGPPGRKFGGTDFRRESGGQNNSKPGFGGRPGFGGPGYGYGGGFNYGFPSYPPPPAGYPGAGNFSGFPYSYPPPPSGYGYPPPPPSGSGNYPPPPSSSGNYGPPAPPRDSASSNGSSNGSYKPY